MPSESANKFINPNFPKEPQRKSEITKAGEINPLLDQKSANDSGSAKIDFPAPKVGYDAATKKFQAPIAKYSKPEQVAQ